MLEEVKNLRLLGANVMEMLNIVKTKIDTVVLGYAFWTCDI